ncbi:MAG: tetratricopeptide (TPR) repeat protein [bacterium]
MNFGKNCKDSQYEFSLYLRKLFLIFWNIKMIKAKTILLFLVFTLLFFSSSISAKNKKEKLLLPDVIIQSSFREKKEIPQPTHQYDLLELSIKSEPYIPNFDFNSFNLPNGFPQNTEIGWLAKSWLGGLASLLLGDSGGLQRAIVFHKKKSIADQQDAEKIFQELAKGKGRKRDLSLLWLAWLKFDQHQLQKSLSLAQKLRTTARNFTILQEAYYLESFLYLQKNEFLKASKLINEFIKQKGEAQLSFKLRYLYAITLFKKKNWSKTKNVISELIEEYPYSIRYTQFQLILAITQFSLKNYSNSFQAFQETQRLDREGSYSTLLYSGMSWTSYFMQKYKQSLTFAKLWKKNSSKEHPLNGNYHYLLFSNLMSLRSWFDIQSAFSKIKESSPLYNQAAYQVLIYGRNIPQLASLRQALTEKKFSAKQINAYSRVLKAEQFYKKGEYKKAELSYLQAIAIFPNNEEFWKIQYNLGVNYLRAKEHQKAEKTFSNLLTRGAEVQALQLKIQYHLLSSFYQQKKVSKVVQLQKLFQLKKLPKKLKIDVLNILGGTYLLQGNSKEAEKLFFQNWKENQSLLGLKFTILTQYKANQFKKALSLIQQSKTEKNLQEFLFIYRVKSLLSLSKFKLALFATRKNYDVARKHPRLLMDVWMANQMYRYVIRETPKLFLKTNDSKLRIFYYLSLGDAYFNLKKYQKSKSQLFRALTLTDNLKQKSLIKYNLILATYFSKNFLGFQKEAKIYLAGELLPDVRFNITTLLVSEYQKKKDFVSAQRVLKRYLNKHSYQAGQLYLRSMQVLSQQRKYRECFEQGTKGIKKETLFQERDRVFLAGRCGVQSKKSKQVITLVQKSLVKKDSYRRNELKTLLAEAFYHDQQYQNSLELLLRLKSIGKDELVTLELNYLLSLNYVKLEKYSELPSTLGDLQQYRKIQRYIPALKLQAKFYEGTRNLENALSTNLRVFYLLKGDDVEKQKLLMKVTELYLATTHKREAQIVFKRVNIAMVKKHQLEKNYQNVESYFQWIQNQGKKNLEKAVVGFQIRF